MRAPPHLWLWPIALLGTALLAGCTFGYPEIKDYRGDGQIRDESFLYYWKPIRSYEVRFPEFALTEAFSATYALEALPGLPHDKPFLHLVQRRNRSSTGTQDKSLDILISQHPEKVFGDARVEVELRDHRGTVLLHYATPLTSLTWTMPLPSKNEISGWWKESLATGGLPLRPNERYTLAVHYLPGGTTMTERGYFRLVGGSP